ncbi:hypothetical protein F0562_004693 [Nyssa sinensis]|uniref:Peptidase metallopeptidase domain-containing protein n=1 Tax=Nyssa sinensis TaxID=561372 RepID=A0A5J5BZH0_9ASTE|nr:hypothetical protein F0562_004693 [Nyssa sinensis]
MAPKVSQLFSSIFLLFLVFPVLSHAGSFASPKGGKPSPFEFLEHLQGCHKGQKVEGLQELKKYLEKFGYLNYNHFKNHTHAKDDDFDDFLESAIKTYQLNYHLKTTGALDAQTVSKMMMPRCGVADIINGTSWMRAAKKRHPVGHNTIHTIAHYSFFDGNPKWSKTHLTYGFPSGTQSNIISAVARAFDKWASVSHFTFSQIQDYTNADLKVSFHRRDHGDGLPFDGPGGTLAHAWSPSDGRFHYDADEQWSIGPVPNAFDLETVALHEIGHLLGLGHSSVQDAIMFSGIASGVTKGEYQQEIQTLDYDFLEYDFHNSEVKEFPESSNQGVGNLDSSGNEHQETKGMEEMESVAPPPPLIKSESLVP